MIIPDIVREENNFKEIMVSEIEPALAGSVLDSYFSCKTSDKIHLRFYSAGNSDKCIVIVHGYSEFAEKYNEYIYVLLQNGFNVFIPELKGHGYSERTVSNPYMVDIKDFSEYVESIKYLYDNYVKDRFGKKYIIGHSMGGNIAARYIEKYPDDFEKAVLSSPMISINMGGIPRPLALTASFLKKIFGHGKQYIAGKGDFTGISDIAHSSCSSNSRYEYIMNKRRGNKDYQIWSADYNWMHAALKSIGFVLRHTNKISIPVLALKSDADTTVVPEYVDIFAKKVESCRLVTFCSAKHEIFNSGEEDRVRYFKELLDFLA